MEQEKIFPNDATHRKLIAKIYKQLIEFNIKRTSNPIKKQAQGPNRHFMKEDMQMGNRHIER